MERTTNLKRSASQRSTLSAIVEWEGKYQKWMGLMNVFILLTSLFLIFFGIVLVLYYHMDKLDFGKCLKTKFSDAGIQDKSTRISIEFKVE